MSGETDLGKLLAGLRATLEPGTYVFATLTGPIPQGVTARMVFREAEGTTLIVTRAEAEAAGYDVNPVGVGSMFTAAAVGFIAVIATELAKAGMGVNPVAGFYHDHIFVPEGREGDALRILARIAADHAG